MVFIKKYIPLLLIISILSFSCKTKKKLEQKRISEISEIYSNISKQYTDYNTLLIKASTKFDDGKKKLNLKSTIKIIKDSVIIISLSPGLGIEAARIKFTRDSIFMLDRLASKVSMGSYKFVEKKYKIYVSYNDVQSILTNELFIFPIKKGITVKDELLNSFTIKQKENSIDFYRKTIEQIENLISVNAQTYKIEKYIISDVKNKQNVQVQYKDVYSDEFKNMPKSISVLSSADGKFIKINLNYTKVVKNKKLNFSFKIPSKYEKIIY
jgi:hypothetical protein